MNRDLYDPNGFISKAFGPSIWFHLHCVSLNFPIAPTDSDRQTYQTWFELTLKVLPCRACRDNVKGNLTAVRYCPWFDFSSRYHFSHLVWRLHRQVNSECVGSVAEEVSYEQFVNNVKFLCVERK